MALLAKFLWEYDRCARWEGRVFYRRTDKRFYCILIGCVLYCML